MHGDPYRYREPVVPPTEPWWAGRFGYACLALAGVLWAVTLVAAYHRETWGMLGAQFAVGPTGFAVGCLVIARRTRYSHDAARRVVAPLAAGFVSSLIAFVAIAIFFATLWRAL
ncbi:MAG TPA: hypothetical protein VM580_26960 [Labilithrix sp.]|nr:hypothetical protein [Labilithrix sp.]